MPQPEPPQRRFPETYGTELYSRVEDGYEVDQPYPWLRGIAISIGLVIFAVAIWNQAFHKQLPESGPFPEPVQRSLAHPVSLPTFQGFAFEAMAEYEIEALVVSRKRYWFGQDHKMIPVDLALAWGPLTTRQALDEVRYSQSGRWYYYRATRTSPVPADQVFLHSANTHIIPAVDRPDVRREVLRIRRGDRIRLEGWLVDVISPSGNRLRSSRSRRDTGGGSCEILYVTRMEKLP